MSKQVASITYLLEESTLAAATFEDLLSRLDSDRLKT